MSANIVRIIVGTDRDGTVPGIDVEGLNCLVTLTTLCIYDVFDRVPYEVVRAYVFINCMRFGDNLI